MKVTLIAKKASRQLVIVFESLSRLYVYLVARSTKDKDENAVMLSTHTDRLTPHNCRGFHYMTF